ncbi:hypothetical protein V3C99_017691 [Haemonchus contortus]
MLYSGNRFISSTLLSIEKRLLFGYSAKCLSRDVASSHALVFKPRFVVHRTSLIGST